MTPGALAAAIRDLAEMGIVWLETEDDAAQVAEAMATLDVNVRISRDSSGLKRIVEDAGP